MDLLTRDYYSSNADKLARVYAKSQGGISDWFETAFPKGTKILDVGAGSGRDLARLLDGGWDAWGVDPSLAFIAEAEKLYPAVRDRISESALPELHNVPDREYDGILCSAVLMHIPEEGLFDAVFGLRRVLKPGGRFLVSLPTDSNGNPVSERDPEGRLFNGLSPDKLELLLSRLGFSCIGRGESTDSLGRLERKWVMQLFILGTDGKERSIDRIESVLNRDRKVATYKLALFRALAEIGMMQYNRARWLPDGRVALPIQAVAEKWLQYYWPIVASETFIPQTQGETPDSKKPVAFRGQLNSLAQAFRGKGGFSGFLLALRSKSLTDEESALHRKLLTKLCQTIRVGPVTYAGGGGTPEALFKYDREAKAILMDRALWQELCLMAAWVRDATILRWADLTQKLSRQEVKAGKVLGLLLEDPLPEREVGDARDLFLKEGDPLCVWTGAKLARKKFDVDHAIPFSLWHNNDLWNLFPAKSSVNRSKSDKLPSRRLILARKDCITLTWEHAAHAYPERFSAESASFAGENITGQTSWPDSLFSVFAEAVEVTAIQRGAERWEP